MVMRRALSAAATAGAFMAIAGCESGDAPVGEPATVTSTNDDAIATMPDQAAQTSAVVDDAAITSAGGEVIEPSAALVGQGLVIQVADDAPQFCLGTVEDSYPPQCSGPAIDGLDWALMPESEEALGTRWGSARLVGTYDGQIFTLTETPSEPTFQTEPDGGIASDPRQQLCDDPFAAGGQDYDGLSSESFLDGQDLIEAVSVDPAFVGAYTTEGGSVYNVLMAQGVDVSSIESQLRDVWPGGLCVQATDAATQEQVVAAQAVLAAASVPDVRATEASVEGGLDVTVLLADDATISAVLEAVSESLDAGDVNIQGALVPVDS